MKKLFTLIAASLICGSSFAQLQNAGMETWHNYTADTVSLQAPDNWYGTDSAVVAFLQGYGSFIPNYSGQIGQQLFQEPSTIHSGNYAAKLVSRQQDVFGVVPCAMSNARITINVAVLTQTQSVGQSLVFSGGTPVTTMVYGASAWVNYMSPGNDSGEIAVEAIKNINGVDSIIGYGQARFAPTNGFTWVDAHLNYTVSGMNPDTIRIAFLSSGSTPVEGSTLYVDDAALDLTTGINNVTKNDVISIAPNPSTGIFSLHSAGNTLYDVRINSVSGQTVYVKQVASNGQIDLSSLPSGIYFYNLTGEDGKTQQGKLTLVK